MQQMEEFIEESAAEGKSSIQYPIAMHEQATSSLCSIRDTVYLRHCPTTSLHFRICIQIKDTHCLIHIIMLVAT